MSWHINCMEMVAIFLALKYFLPDLRGHHVLVHRQYIGGRLYKSSRGFAFTSTVQTGAPNPLVVPRQAAFTQSSLYPGGPEHRSRHPVETMAEAQGMEAPPRGGGADMEVVWPGSSGSVCPLWLRWYRYGRGYVCIPDWSAPGSSGESLQGPSAPAYSPAVARKSLVCRSSVSP